MLKIPERQTSDTDKGHLMPFFMPLSFKFHVPAHHTGHLIPAPKGYMLLSPSPGTTKKKVNLQDKRTNQTQ
jgi:hypothetical protein